FRKQLSLKGYFRMKDRSRSVYDLGLLIVIVSAVVFASITVYSQNQTSSQTPAAPAQGPRPSPSPRPTPTPINWSTDPLLKRFVFRSIGPASRSEERRVGKECRNQR